MILLAPLAGMAVAAAVLLAGTTWRVLTRRDHRCLVVTRPTGCDACTAVLAGTGLGGHVVCACGAASPHLVGPDLLRWRADHLGEAWPALPPEGAERAAQAARAEADAAGDGGLADAVDAVEDAERRASAEARRRPDPRTAQVLQAADEASVKHP